MIKLPLIVIFLLMCLYSIGNAGSTTVWWTSPGDDSLIGTAYAYDLRYAIFSINDVNWEQATPFDVSPVPLIAGTRQSATQANLEDGVLHYFGIKTVDENGNWSLLSNIDSVVVRSIGPPQFIWREEAQ